MFLKVCDPLIAELEDRFKNQHISSVLSIEQALIKVSNGGDFEGEIAHRRKLCYKHDIFYWPDLTQHLPMLQDFMKKATSVKQVTQTTTICDAMNSYNIFKEMVPTVHQLLHLYIMTPITSGTSKYTFSALQCLFTYLQSSMTECKLNESTEVQTLGAIRIQLYHQCFEQV